MKKYGMVVLLSEELLGEFFSKDLLKKPNDELCEAVKCVALANLKIPVERWNNVECEINRNCLNDTYMFRLRSYVEIDGFYEVRNEYAEYPKKMLKGGF